MPVPHRTDSEHVLAHGPAPPLSWSPSQPAAGKGRSVMLEVVRRGLPWVLSIWIAYVFVWYLQYKFTGADGSVWLFTVLTDWIGVHGHEKAMRIGTGVAELIASILLFIPATQVVGAALSLGIMSGAIFFHVVSPLGIDPYGDG